MGTKVVALRLQEVGRDNFTAVAVEEREGSAERGRRDTPEDGLSNNTSPAGLSIADGFVEEVVKEERLQVRSLLISLGDVTQEDTLIDYQ